MAIRTEVEYAEVALLIQFLDVCSKGLVRPWDPGPILDKLDKLSKKGHDISHLQMCCPTSTEVRDVIDLKPYILGAAERISEMLDVPYIEFGGEDRQSGSRHSRR